MILVKKLKFLHVLCLSKIDREKVFADVLEKKEAFKDYKNNSVRKTENENFSKGVSPWFWSKICNFVNDSFYAEYTQKKYLAKAKAKLAFLQRG